MKRIFILMLTCTCMMYAANAQFRKMKPEEIAYYNKVHAELWASTIHVYKDWKEAGDEKEFDAAKMWCSVEGVVKCYGTTPVSTGTVDSYSLDDFEEFTMPGEQSGGLMVAAYSQIKDFQNAEQIAKALKGMAITNLKVQLYSNVMGGEFVLGYCDKMPPVKIELPVPATLALKGIRSADCPMYNSGTKTVDMSGKYWDNALIFLGQPVAKKENDELHDGITRTKYSIGFNKAKIGKMVTQNIVVQLIGDAADIDAAIKLIDWKKLDAMLDK